MINKDNTKKRNRIRTHIRKKISGSPECPRLAVYRSLNHLYAQIIDDINGKTLVSASTLTSDLKDEVKNTKSRIAKAKLIGITVAKKALENNIKTVVFDRSGYKYHGNIKAIADGAREGGLKF